MPARGTFDGDGYYIVATEQGDHLVCVVEQSPFVPPKGNHGRDAWNARIGHIDLAAIEMEAGQQLRDCWTTDGIDVR